MRLVGYRGLRSQSTVKVGPFPPLAEEPLFTDTQTKNLNNPVKKKYLCLVNFSARAFRHCPTAQAEWENETPCYANSYNKRSKVKDLMRSDLFLLFASAQRVAMASKSTNFLSVAFCLLFFSVAVSGKYAFDFGPLRKTHLHFFFHNIMAGPNATAVVITQAPTRTTTTGRFGQIVMIDNALTEGANLSSKVIGRAQGFYATAALEEPGFLMTHNYYFIDGVYKGSTLAILGRNNIFEKRREMAVVGGTGYFRLAKGYAVAKTVSFNQTSGDAVAEYDVYVVHGGR